MSTAYLIPLLEKIIPSLSKKIERKEGEEKDPWEVSHSYHIDNVLVNGMFTCTDDD